MRPAPGRAAPLNLCANRKGLPEGRILAPAGRNGAETQEPGVPEGRLPGLYSNHLAWGAARYA